MSTRSRLRAVRNRVIHRRKRLRSVHASAYIHSKAEVSPDLIAHEFAFVAPYCKVDPGVELGRYVMLARHAAVVGDDHVQDIVGVPMQFSGRPAQSRTYIGDDVWIGYGAVVRRGVTIERGAVVGAGAVVTKDVGPYEIVGGVPARRLGLRFATDADREAHDEMLSGPVVPPSFTGALSAPDMQARESH